MPQNLLANNPWRGIAAAGGLDDVARAEVVERDRARRAQFDAAMGRAKDWFTRGLPGDEDRAAAANADAGAAIRRANPTHPDHRPIWGAYFANALHGMRNLAEAPGRAWSGRMSDADMINSATAGGLALTLGRFGAAGDGSLGVGYGRRGGPGFSGTSPLEDHLWKNPKFAIGDALDQVSPMQSAADKGHIPGVVWNKLQAAAQNLRKARNLNDSGALQSAVDAVNDVRDNEFAGLNKEGRAAVGPFLSHTNRANMELKIGPTPSDAPMAGATALPKNEFGSPSAKEVQDRKIVADQFYGLGRQHASEGRHQGYLMSPAEREKQWYEDVANDGPIGAQREVERQDAKELAYRQGGDDFKQGRPDRRTPVSGAAAIPTVTPNVGSKPDTQITRAKSYGMPENELFNKLAPPPPVARTNDLDTYHQFLAIAAARRGGAIDELTPKELRSIRQEYDDINTNIANEQRQGQLRDNEAELEAAKQRNSDLVSLNKASTARRQRMDPEEQDFATTKPVPRMPTDMPPPGYGDLDKGPYEGPWDELPDYAKKNIRIEHGRNAWNRVLESRAAGATAPAARQTAPMAGPLPPARGVGDLTGLQKTLGEERAALNAVKQQPSSSFWGRMLGRTEPTGNDFISGPNGLEPVEARQRRLDNIDNTLKAAFDARGDLGEHDRILGLARQQFNDMGIYHSDPMQPPPAAPFAAIPGPEGGMDLGGYNRNIARTGRLGGVSELGVGDIGEQLRWAGQQKQFNNLQAAGWLKNFAETRGRPVSPNDIPLGEDAYDMMHSLRPRATAEENAAADRIHSSVRDMASYEMSLRNQLNDYTRAQRVPFGSGSPLERTGGALGSTANANAYQFRRTPEGIGYYQNMDGGNFDEKLRTGYAL